MQGIGTRPQNPDTDERARTEGSETPMMAGDQAVEQER
jgi:hypothetical protein